MNETLAIENAAYKAGLACSLFEVITNMASAENVSPVLFDLICMACDTNFEIRQALDAAAKVNHA